MSPDDYLDLAFPPEECVYTVAMTTYGPALQCEGFFGTPPEEPNQLNLLPHLPYWFGQAG